MTPFDTNGRLDLSCIDSFCKFQADAGIAGFYILGTWGGFALQSLEERMAVAEAYAISSFKYGLELIVHITSNSFADTVMLGQHALSCGIENISLTLPPYYSTGGFLEIDDYCRYFDRVSSELGKSIFLYNNQRTTSVLISPEEFIRLSKYGVCGVKDGSKNLAWVVKVNNLINSCSEYSSLQVIPGNTISIVYAFLYGLKAVTSGTSVVYPEQTVRIVNLINNNDFYQAAHLHQHVLALRQNFNIISSAPSSAHFLLRSLHSESCLSYSRSEWPIPSKEQELSLLTRSDEILSLINNS